jgi:hypothetical protein
VPLATFGFIHGFVLAAAAQMSRHVLNDH